MVGIVGSDEYRWSGSYCGVWFRCGDFLFLPCLLDNMPILCPGWRLKCYKSHLGGFTSEDLDRMVNPLDRLLFRSCYFSHHAASGSDQILLVHMKLYIALKIGSKFNRSSEADRIGLTILTQFVQPGRRYGYTDCTHSHRCNRLRARQPAAHNAQPRNRRRRVLAHGTNRQFIQIWIHK